MGIENENDKVWVSVETTINLGNYENVKIMGGRSQSVLPEEDPVEIRDDIMEEMLADILSRRKEIKRKAKE